MEDALVLMLLASVLWCWCNCCDIAVFAPPPVHKQPTFVHSGYLKEYQSRHKKRAHSCLMPLHHWTGSSQRETSRGERTWLPLIAQKRLKQGDITGDLIIMRDTRKTEHRTDSHWKKNEGMLRSRWSSHGNCASFICTRFAQQRKQRFCRLTNETWQWWFPAVPHCLHER